MKQLENIFLPNTSPEDILIRSIWKIHKSEFGDEKETILPKGTAEIIFNLSSNILCYKDSEKSSFGFYQCNINGLNTSPIHLKKNETQIFIGIQLHSYALKCLFGIPAKEFTNRVFNGFDVCDSLKDLFEQILSNDSFHRQVNVIKNWLKLRLKIHNEAVNKCLIFDLHHFPEIESLSVKSICRRYNMSDRHLRRLSSNYLGMNTEDFILYRKYLKSLQLIHNKEKSLTSVAYASGFYDQAHFIREFKTFTGLTPGDYRHKMSSLPGHLFSPIS